MRNTHSTAAARYRVLAGGLILAAATLRCGSVNEVQVRPIVLTGIFSGSQDGTDATIPFVDEPLLLFLEEIGDSVFGTWEGTGLHTGNVRGSIDRSNGFFIELVFELTAPCTAEFAGSAEARQGILFNGETRIGIAGAYSGTYCDGDFSADYLVQEVR